MWTTLRCKNIFKCTKFAGAVLPMWLHLGSSQEMLSFFWTLPCLLLSLYLCYSTLLFFHVCYSAEWLLLHVRVRNEVWLQPHFRRYWDGSPFASFKLSPNIYSTCGSLWGASFSCPSSQAPPPTHPASLAHNRLLTCIAGSWFRLSTWLVLNDRGQATSVEAQTDGGGARKYRTFMFPPV